MKKLFCFLLCLTLIFSSISLCFATPTQWDTSDQANLRYIYQNLISGGNLYNLINTISSRTNSISNTLTDIKGLLSYGSHSVADLVDSILTWMSPIYNSITSIPTDLTSIKEGLWKTLSNGSSEAYLQLLEKGLTNYYISDSWDLNKVRLNSHANLINDYSNGKYTMRFYSNNGGTYGNYDLYWNNGSPIGNIATEIWLFSNSFANWTDDMMYGFNTAQSYTDWTDLSSSSFTPSSVSNGFYSWLSNIQAPVARLSYVLASDERIEAQQAAAANEQAVVDNFIDSSGDGSTSTSNIGSVSDLSAGYKQNFGTDASPSGIFDIFNSDHASWFSQETKNQLDTTSNTRLTKGSQSETPLLDKQIEDIYNALGVKQP